jgi:large subunit ribosomal protein L18e
VRKNPKTENVYVRLLVKLYKFLARRTGATFNSVVLKRIMMSRINRSLMSLNMVTRYVKRYNKAGKEDQVVVVVGTITDDARVVIPKMKICALRFTATARARIVAAGGECLTFDQLALQRPTGANTILLRGRRTARTANKYFGTPGAPGSKSRPRVISKGRKFERARGRRNGSGFKV